MAYGANDIRSTMNSATRAGAATPAYADTADPEAFDFSILDPDEQTGLGSRTWVVRTQNVVLAYTTACSGDAFARKGQPDEYVVVLPHDTSAVRVEADGHSEDVVGKAIVIVPPGDSVVTATAGSDFVRVFTVRNDDVANLARNAASYARPHPHVALLEDWPEPPEGYRLRVYRGVAEIERDPSRFSRIFRSRAIMVNFSYHRDGPRDTTTMSPHDHADFEQISLGVEGEFIHHLRTPWGLNKAGWRADQHIRIGSPSVTIIPPPLLHTTEHCGPGRNQLLDIFGPPRDDFSAKGWVLNADEYPARPGLMSQS
jgi:hypothetical protein